MFEKQLKKFSCGIILKFFFRTFIVQHFLILLFFTKDDKIKNLQSNALGYKDTFTVRNYDVSFTAVNKVAVVLDSVFSFIKIANEFEFRRSESRDVISLVLGLIFADDLLSAWRPAARRGLSSSRRSSASSSLPF